jgi:hypothetical protein
MDVKNRLLELELDGSDLESCPMAGNGIVDVEPSCSTSVDSIGRLVSYESLYRN